MVDLLPSVLFVSCCETNPSEIIKLMLGDLPEVKQYEDIEMFDWHISTKYYETDVRLCSKRSKSLTSPEFASFVEGIVIYFEPDSDRGLDAVVEWLPFVEDYEAEVKILVCNHCKDTNKSNTSSSKLKVQEWCVKHGFELVELQPNVDDEYDSEEEDFVETRGIARIIQALQAHLWPNLILKERKDPTTMAGLWHGGFCNSTVSEYNTNSFRVHSSNLLTENDGENSSEVCERESSVHRTLDNIEPTAEELLRDENTDFCDLFSQLSVMKEKANSMPSVQRKKFAEDVVLAYWRAIGGDSDEICDC